jgi:hypothetical protein
MGHGAPRGATVANKLQPGRWPWCGAQPRHLSGDDVLALGGSTDKVGVEEQSIA